MGHPATPATPIGHLLSPLGTLQNPRPLFPRARPATAAPPAKVPWLLFNCEQAASRPLQFGACVVDVKMADSAVGHEQSHKSHRARQAGASAKKKPKPHKKNKLNANDKDSQKQHNPKPLSWRASHPYVLVYRFEDVTPPEKVHTDKKCDRSITLYGYLRGCNMKTGTKVHIAGVAGLTSLPDPCPLPSAAKKKGLRDKEKLSYFAEERVDRAER